MTMFFENLGVHLVHEFKAYCKFHAGFGDAGALSEKESQDTDTEGAVTYASPFVKYVY